MKFLVGSFLVLSLALLPSCIKHEVIPPPTFEVELPAFFRGSLNGASYEIIKDIDGYFSKATQVKQILSTPNPSNIIYYSALQSSDKLDYIQIGLGKLIFNADYSIDPTLEAFTKFFEDNTEPLYSAGAEAGVEIVYRDSEGKIWISDENLGAALTFKLTSLSQESDETGDYMKFTARFDAILALDVDVNDPDYGSTITIESALYQGYFKR